MGVSIKPSLLDVRSTEKGKEKQSLGTASPIVSLPYNLVPCPATKTSASAVAELGTGTRSFSVMESLRQRAQELILRQKECIRASISACRILERPPHRFTGLAHGDGADFQSLSVPAKARVPSSVKVCLV